MISVFHSHQHALHAPAQEVDAGMASAFPEVPERIAASLDALAQVPGAVLAEVEPAAGRDLLAVHSSVLVDGIRELSRSLGEHEVFQPFMVSSPIFADASAPVTLGTYEAACYAAGCALAAAASAGKGDEVSVALCRPPGHHAGRSFCGGFCYFNNAALAAQRLSQQGTVGILDIDYHHGHGTQDIFYARGDVAYASLHADPRHEYPYRFGRADETGAGDGTGCNLNLPLPPDCDERLYLATLDAALEWLKGKGTKSLVVSLGFDTCTLDPFGGLGLEPGSYREVARKIRGLNTPLVIVFEGGYNLAALGPCWTNFMAGLQRPRTQPQSSGNDHVA